MKILIVLVGLPRSSKSTWAKSKPWVMVNPDSIRLALHGKAFDATREREVWHIAHIMVSSLFLAGHNVVVLDACNVTNKARKEWNSAEWTTYYKCIDTPKEECIKRALANDQQYLVPVIERMAKELSWPKSNVLTPKEEEELILGLGL